MGWQLPRQECATVELIFEGSFLDIANAQNVTDELKRAIVGALWASVADVTVQLPGAGAREGTAAAAADTDASGPQESLRGSRGQEHRTIQEGARTARL